MKKIPVSKFTEKENKYFIFYEDVYASLLKLKNNSIDCIITSPPYWDQRDYDTQNQIGSEKTLQKYLKKLTYIFNTIKTKMSENGVFFLNLGDKYIYKYGNNPLGLIPYKLSYLMTLNGWKLVDILIWYKIGHMPQSCNNRFTNTYEPIFVFVKDGNNYYNQYTKTHNISKIIKTTFDTSESIDHPAIFPQDLVYKSFQNIF